MKFGITKSVVLSLAAAALMLPAVGFAQDKAAPKAAKNDDVSRWDIFAGYSYLAPKGTVNVPLPKAGFPIEAVSYNSVNIGGIVSVARYFNRYVGAQAEVGIHEYAPSGSKTNNDGFTTIAGGLIARYPAGDVTPFVHALVGGALVDGPLHNPFTWGPDITVGGGLDYATPFFNHHLSIRLFQADYEYMHANFGVRPYGGIANINAARLSAGLVFHVGTIAPPPPVTLSCSATPLSVFPGEPINLSATAGELNPKLKATYTWSGSGVKGNDTTASVDTSSLAPGSYSVKASVSEGPKPGQSAECSASFTVKAFEPPTISCSANPTTIKPGETSAVSATGVSPQNRPLTYSYSASAGTVSGNGRSATYSSAGAPTGTSTITCSVSDDKGQTATATTSVSIVAPYVPPAPKMSSLCSPTFEKDAKRPTRVDNEAKACLDDIALTLQKQTDATAAIVGSSDAKEKAAEAKAAKAESKKKHPKPVADAAAERAVNTKEYLVTEKGIDASRIAVYTDATDAQKVSDYLIPAGASFTVSGVTKVSADVKPEVRKPLAERHPAKKAAAKKAAKK